MNRLLGKLFFLSRIKKRGAASRASKGYGETGLPRYHTIFTRAPPSACTT